MPTRAWSARCCGRWRGESWSCRATRRLHRERGGPRAGLRGLSRAPADPGRLRGAAAAATAFPALLAAAAAAAAGVLALLGAAPAAAAPQNGSVVFAGKLLGKPVIYR